MSRSRSPFVFAVFVLASFAAVGAFVAWYYPTKQAEWSRASLASHARQQAQLAAFTMAPGVEFSDASLLRDVLRGLARDRDFQFARVSDGAGLDLSLGREAIGMTVRETIHTALGNEASLTVTLSSARIERESQRFGQASFGVAAIILLLGLAVSFLVTRQFRTLLALADEEKARLLAERASAAKTDFVATISHEIRTPLNGILALTSLLTETQLPTDATEHVRTIHRSGQTLLALVNDVLDFSKIEEGKLTLERDLFDPLESAESVIELFWRKCRDKGVDLVLSADAMKPVRGDRVRFEQVLSNLVGNAVKFTASGTIEVRLSSLRDGADSVLVTEVKDSGVGIPQERLDAVFGRYEQASGKTTSSFGGTGLGLTISRALARAMNGDITVTSVLGKGSTFTFVARFHDSEQASQSDPPIHLEGRVLVVEDNATIRELLLKQLTSWGLTAQVCASAEEAQELLQSENLQDFAAILLDVELPQMSGPELARRLRERAANLPILLLSSLSDASEHARLRREFRLLPKPVRRTTLLKALSEILGKAILADVSPQATTIDLRDASGQPGVVLVAEDNPTNQQVMRSLLTALGVRFEIVDDGQAALSSACERSYALCFMDMQMPNLDGIGATQKIRQEETRTGRERLKIVALTAQSFASERERALAAGMDDFVAKPITLSRLREVLIGVGGQACLAQRPPSDAGTRVDPILDTDTLGELLEIGLGPIASSYRTTSESDVSAIADSFRSGDWEGVRRSAHRLKGGSHSVGAIRVAALAKNIEDAAKSSNTSIVEAALGRLHKELRDAHAALAMAAKRGSEK